MSNIVDELRDKIRGEVRFDQISRALYSTDASIYQIEPVGVVVPRDADDIQAVLEVAGRNQTPVLVRGGGTSLSGQSVGEAILMDCSKYFNNVLEINSEERWVRVQPGVVLDHLNKALEPHGLWFGPDVAPSNRATLGGMMGNNSAGMRSIVYGKTIDHVISQNVLLSDGTRAVFEALDEPAFQAKTRLATLEAQIYREIERIAEANRAEVEARFPKVLRRVGGYNLDAWGRNGVRNMAHMAIGSEGTLVAVTEAKLKLVPRPKMTSLSIIHFSDMFAALDAMVDVVSCSPTSVELIDRLVLDMTRQSPEYARKLTFVEGDPNALLIVEFFGASVDELKAQQASLEAKMRNAGHGYAMVHLLDRTAIANCITIRKQGQGLLNGIKGDARPIAFVEDCAVPVAKLASFIRTFAKILEDNGTSGAFYAHASVGLLHVRPLINLKNAEGIQRMYQIAQQASDLVLEYGGSFSSEHGDGLTRSCFNEKMFGPQLYQAFRDVKSAFDPGKLMNPGKIVDAPAMTENLRYGTNYRSAEFKTVFDYTHDGGSWARAIEACNGMGECRKIGDGTMCPSFQATRDETHSTRGRANVLRLAMTGRLPGESLTSRRVYDVLDLCLECKGCKAECSTNVDMAKYKYEFLHNYYAANGKPLRARLFGNIHYLSKLGSAFAPLSNWTLGLAPTKWVLSQVGITPSRNLPPFVRDTFESRMPALHIGRQAPAASGAPQVALFVDTYMNHNYPSIGVAAAKVLQSAGVEVFAPQRPCCGRPFISKGLLDEAKSLAARNIELLAPIARAGIPIVGAEPSCLLTLREEYVDFFPDSADAKLVASKAMLLEEFLPSVKDKLKFAPDKKNVLIHGHCHQKAACGMGPVTGALKLNPGFAVTESGAGCCGMAGAFGFESEHYELSMKVGEDRLFPKVRAQSPDTEIAVSGVSCRQQVEHGTGRKPKHWIEVMAESLA
ncbi:MAG: FAD-binding protein [Chloroflexi bacterium]|nr:FAD-binding protein [Chloroflexota bacterium]